MDPNFKKTATYARNIWPEHQYETYDLNMINCVPYFLSEHTAETFVRNMVLNIGSEYGPGTFVQNFFTQIKFLFYISYIILLFYFRNAVKKYYL